MILSEEQYLKLLQKTLLEGEERKDRTGVGTIGLFGTQMRFDLRKGFPLLTTKKMAWKSIVEELLWFIQSDTDANHLREKGVHIWDGNSTREFLDKRGLDYPEGELGPIYGRQWRNWGAPYPMYENSPSGIDQLAQIIHTLKTDPTDRRMIVSAWNVTDIEKMALPPCHILFQFWVSQKDNSLSCQMYQRSCDLFLGVPFNIASYSLLTHLIARVTGFEVGEFIWIGGDTHIYKNHVDAVKEQLTRTPYPFPRLILPEVTSLKEIEKLSYKDMKLIEYVTHPKIKAEMAV